MIQINSVQNGKQCLINGIKNRIEPTVLTYIHPNPKVDVKN